MIDISFEVNGKKVSLHNIGNALESAVLKSVRESIAKTVGSTWCPEHGQKPTIKVSGRNLDSLDYEIAGCCDQLISMIKKKLI